MIIIKFNYLMVIIKTLVNLNFCGFEIQKLFHLKIMNQNYMLCLKKKKKSC